MAAGRLSHDERERLILSDLEESFPSFTGSSLAWSKVPEGQDPPDFVSHGHPSVIGLELIEWLDGEQMSPAKGREFKRENIRDVLNHDWQLEYKPQNFRLAVVMPNLALRVTKAEEDQLHREFFSCASNVDRSWHTNTERFADSYLQGDFSGYPVLGKYVSAIRYIGGEPHGFCWIDIELDGGSYDPTASVETLKRALEKKLSLYSQPESKARLKAHNLTELYLLVHGGFNAYWYNTPSHPLSLADIAARGAAFYAAHPQREVFKRVWFFDRIEPGDVADDLNQLLGYPPGYGRVRWLAQLWPTLSVYPGSIAA